MTFEDIKKHVIASGSDNVGTFGGEYRGGAYVQQHPDEIAEVLEFLLNAKPSYENMLEVGSAAGGNAKMFCEILNIKNLLIIDDNQHLMHTVRSENLKNINYEEYIGNSQSKSASEWVASFSRKFDIIYIDADHEYIGVKNDVENYLKFLKPDGYMIFHDYFACEGVKKIVDSIRTYNLDKTLVTSTRYCGIAVCRNLNE